MQPLSQPHATSLRAQVRGVPVHSVETLHDMPQGVRRITPHPQDSQATEGVNEKRAKSQWRKKPARDQESGRRGGASKAENRRAGPPKQTRHGRVRHLRAQPHSGTLEHNLGQQPSTHWEGAPPGVHPSCEGGGGPVVQAGGTGAGRVAQAGAGSWCQRADTWDGVRRNPRRRGVGRPRPGVGEPPGLRG